MDEIRLFIEAYTSEDLYRIKFDWNGKHSAEFRDENQKYRKEIWDKIKSGQAQPHSNLLADLLEAETSFAEEAWGIDSYVHEIAEMMLLRGGAEFVETFWRCKLKSMDTYGELSCTQIPGALSESLREYCQEKANQNIDAGKKKFWNDAIKFFEWKKSESHG
jgi:hypothetical protein